MRTRARNARPPHDAGQTHSYDFNIHHTRRFGRLRRVVDFPAFVAQQVDPRGRDKAVSQNNLGIVPPEATMVCPNGQLNGDVDRISGWSNAVQCGKLLLLAGKWYGPGFFATGRYVVFVKGAAIPL